MSITIRFFRESDALKLLKIFNNTIHSTSLEHYTQEQASAWAPMDRDQKQWIKSFQNKAVFVACKEEVVIGFIELENNGHIDKFYIHGDHIREGIGTLLYAQVESLAKEKNHTRLFVEASITAKDFFIKNNYKILEKQAVIRKGVTLTNYRMEKLLR